MTIPSHASALQREPDQWFWASEAIAEENPVPPEDADKVRLVAEAWIDWGRQRGFVPA